MKLSPLLAALSVVACTSLASAVDTVVRVEDQQLVVTLPDGKVLRCSSLTLSPIGKASVTLSVVGGSVQLESGGMTVQAAELRFPEPAKPAAK